MDYDADAKLLFLIDRIEHSSYPVTETGYALVYRAWMRSLSGSGEIYVAYPDSPWSLSRSGELEIMAERVTSFTASPYAFYRSQRDSYQADADVGSVRCHSATAPLPVNANSCSAVVWRQETGAPAQTVALLRALSSVERDTLVYLSPELALDPRYASKVLPRNFDERLTPVTYLTTEHPNPQIDAKIAAVLEVVHTRLKTPDTLIVKPLYGNNGEGIHVLGHHPIRGASSGNVDDPDVYKRLLASYGELVVQEYVPSVRAPADVNQAMLGDVPHDRHDFGELRFLLIDGEPPRDATGRPCLLARRVPTDTSLVADSGISHATSLSSHELAFLQRLGPYYRTLGIHFGGGDLIRTPDPKRPFVFTDAARSVCGHAVVTGALNGEPYLIVDQILDSIDRHMRSRHASMPSTVWSRAHEG
jgi:hypothetical protein